MKIKIFDNRLQVDRQPLNVNRGYLFGDGFFTTGIILAGILSHSRWHMARLEYSAQKLKLNAFNARKLFAELNPLLHSIDKAAVRISVSREQESRGYGFELSAPPEVCVQLSPLIDPPERPCELFFAKTPISSNPLLAGIKHLNRLDNVLAAQEIQHLHQEALLCLDQDVICGSRSNLFIYYHNKWLTPKLDRAGINGITRQRIIEKMLKKGIKIEECDINKQQILKSESAFITNSLVGFWPVNRIMNNKIMIDQSEELRLALNFNR